MYGGNGDDIIKGDFSVVLEKGLDSVLRYTEKDIDGESQGKTFDKVIIDMGKGAFEHGQTYVALSRCRSLEGIVLKQKLMTILYFFSTNYVENVITKI